MKDKNGKLDCMFSNVECAGYALLICNYGLRDNRLSDLPKAGMIAMADIMEHSHRAIQNDSFDRDEDDDPNGDNVSDFRRGNN